MSLFTLGSLAWRSTCFNSSNKRSIAYRCRFSAHFTPCKYDQRISQEDGTSLVCKGYSTPKFRQRCVLQHPSPVNYRPLRRAWRYCRAPRSLLTRAFEPDPQAWRRKFARLNAKLQRLTVTAFKHNNSLCLQAIAEFKIEDTVPLNGQASFVDIASQWLAAGWHTGNVAGSYQGREDLIFLGFFFSGPCGWLFSRARWSRLSRNGQHPKNPVKR